MFNIAFRTDATSQIGTGHFMRCLTLADKLKQLGAHIRFISRELPAHMCKMLKEKNIEYVLLENIECYSSEGDLAHSHWLSCDQSYDAEMCSRLLSDKKWDWLIVDHYALDVRWESILRAKTKKIMVIDDIADRMHDCDILLDQNYYENMNARYLNKVPYTCQLLLGPRYSILRDEFKELHNMVRPRKKPIQRLFVFFGGVDLDNYTGTIVNILSKILNTDLCVDVVIGDQHPNRKEIQTLCKKSNFRCHVQTSQMAELMSAADFAIGASGSASWERCCLGLPTLMVSLAENQVSIAKGLESLGVGKYLGSHDTVNNEIIRNAIDEFFQDSNTVNELSENAYAIVDGYGVDRVSGLLTS